MHKNNSGSNPNDDAQNAPGDTLQDDETTVAAPTIESRIIQFPTVAENNKIIDWNQGARINAQQISDGVKLGIGLAFISMTLNGLTDNLLFNIPTSMLMWLLGALGGALCLLPENDDIQRRQNF